MSCRHELRSHAVGILEQFAEFEPGVANNARVWRPGRLILGDEVIDDPAEIGREVQGIERNVESVGHPPGIRRVAGAATTLLVSRSSGDNRQR